MRGVIIWFCSDTRQAVVWCDDSGDLAYARDAAAWLDPAAAASVGDYVAFELGGGKATRTCARLQVLATGHAPGLARMLRDEPQPAPRRLRACA